MIQTDRAAINRLVAKKRLHLPLIDGKSQLGLLARRVMHGPRPAALSDRVETRSTGWQSRYYPAEQVVSIVERDGMICQRVDPVLVSVGAAITVLGELAPLSVQKVGGKGSTRLRRTSTLAFFLEAECYRPCSQSEGCPPSR